LLIELVKIVFNVEYLIFYSFLDALTKEKKSIELMYLFIGKIDVAISTTSLKSGDLKIYTPSFDASNKQMYPQFIIH
jgi:DNA mismatch repair ATPase MutS